jgi:cytochrome c556
MHTPAISALFLVLFLAVSGAGAAKAPAPARRLPAPDHLDAQTRRDTKARMGQHASTMENLVRAVVLLDRPTIRVLATRLADEEVVARAGSIRDKLPEQFFAQQDELEVVARKLAAAATDVGDDKALADSFSALTRTCVGCHSTYLHASPAPADAKGGGTTP